MDYVKITGKIKFDPKDKTKKHESQNSWKKMAMVMIGGDESDYYSWFIKKRYSLILNPPIRRSHISFINDSNKELTQNGNLSLEEANELWGRVKKKWDGVKIEIELRVDPRTDGRTWWLGLTDDSKTKLQSIRDELGLGKPYFGFHMSIGYANDKSIVHSEYIYDTIKRGTI